MNALKMRLLAAMTAADRAYDDVESAARRYAACRLSTRRSLKAGGAFGTAYKAYYAALAAEAALAAKVSKVLSQRLH